MESNKDKAKEKKKNTHWNHHTNFDFEATINKLLGDAKIPVEKLFLDTVHNKPFLRKLTVRTKEGHHFRMVIGKQELSTGHIMVGAILKAKYLQALKMPIDKLKKTSNHGKHNNKHKHKHNPRGMGRDAQRKNNRASEGKPKLVKGKGSVHSKAKHANVPK